MVDVRFSEFTKNEGMEQYDWGRVRMAMKVLVDDKLAAFGKLKHMLKADDKGIEYLREFYEKKKQEYLETNGLSEDDWDISPEEFYDMVRQNIKATMKDAIFLSTIMAIVIAMKSLPDDDSMDYQKRTIIECLLDIWIRSQMN